MGLSPSTAAMGQISDANYSTAEWREQVESKEMQSRNEPVKTSQHTCSSSRTPQASAVGPTPAPAWFRAKTKLVPISGSISLKPE